MTTSGASSSHLRAQELADRLRAHLGEELLERLTRDPLGTIENDLGLEIVFRDEARTDDGCGVDGAYTRGTSKLIVAESASLGRRNFTALHEAGHYLCAEDDDILDDIAMSPDRSLEEAVANIFAADVLIPREHVDEIVGDEGLTAAAVLETHRRTEASRSACCAASVRHLPGNGYVILAHSSGEVVYAAGTPHQYILAPGAIQPEDSTLARAGRIGRARGQERLIHRTGTSTPEFNVDAIEDGGWVFAIAFDGPAPWGGLTILDDRPLARTTAECPHCEHEFEAWSKPCIGCGDYKCPRCGKCDCSSGPAERPCPSCYTRVLPHLLVPGGCVNCS